MLGKTQRDWLLKSMKESDADFFFVISSVPFMIPTVAQADLRQRPTRKKHGQPFLTKREILIKEWEKMGKKVFCYDWGPAQQLCDQDHR